MKLDKLLNFLDLTHKFQQIRRTVFVNGEDRMENDVEHSYQLALVAWYLSEADNLKLDINKVIKYALVHDLVEVYAGDTYFYTSAEEKAGKAEREAEALTKLESEFPQLNNIWTLVHEYESRDDAESKFVYALDKFITPANIYLDGGRTWREHNVLLQMLLDGKDGKVTVDETVGEYWKLLVEKLKAGEKDLFPQGDTASTIN